MKPRLSSPHRRSVAAFTLVELLSVLAIVAVLAAIIFPVAGGMRKRSLEARAFSNLRQLGVAHLAYASDNKGRYPVDRGVGGEPMVWQGALIPYLGITPPTGMTIDKYTTVLRQDRESVFNVPDSKSTEERSAAAVTIARNAYLNLTGDWKYMANRVPSPARTILLAEIIDKNVDHVTGIGSPKTNGSRPNPEFRRNGGEGALVGFCDGHVEPLTREELRDNISAASGNRWRWW